MKKNGLLLLFVCLYTIGIQAQKRDTYEIEKLEGPNAPCTTEAPAEMYKGVIGSEFIRFSATDPLVSAGAYPVIGGFLRAYQEHRPVTISPDIVWLLICQGFSQHINHNAEALRKKFVGFEGKRTLEVRRQVASGTTLRTFPWESVFPEFTRQIDEAVGKELVGILTADFSTTTPASLIASQITVMDAMKSYFRYKVTMIGCGIPRVTIEGTLEDWEKISERLDKLARYDLAWWTDELKPVIGEIIKAKKGKFNKKFWMKMIRYHTKGLYGSLTDLDGWLLKFYPYLESGERWGMKKLDNIGLLPKEIVSVPFEFEARTDDEKEGVTTTLEFWSGFIGLRQDSETLSLKPEIGWFICKEQTKKEKATARPWSSLSTSN